jgi:hypothetical protein
VSSAINGEQAGQYSSGEAFRLRMESQCQEIEQYRQSVLNESGRELSLDEAAMEWIARYAADFSRQCEFSFD